MAGACLGQATVEAAFLLPVIFVLVLVLCQPAILLYDRAVMEGAASETCRLLATNTQVSGLFDGDVAQEYALRRLGAIPPVSIFHVHEDGCYSFEFSGGEGNTQVSCTITNQVRLLPLFGQAATLMGAAENGVYTLQVSASAPARPEWATGNPKEWQSLWDN